MNHSIALCLKKQNKVGEKMKALIARTSFGGQDLYYGVPNLESAVVSKVESIEDSSDYCTELTLILSNGSTMKLIIKQER